MLADLYGCPVKTTASHENGALGVAILAGVGAGVFSSVEQGCDALVKVDKVQSPIPENQAAYDRFYPVYTALYQDLKARFQQLAAL
jgi:xylulokinase